MDEEIIDIATSESVRCITLDKTYSATADSTRLVTDDWTMTAVFGGILIADGQNRIPIIENNSAATLPIEDRRWGVLRDAAGEAIQSATDDAEEPDG